MASPAASTPPRSRCTPRRRAARSPPSPRSRCGRLPARLAPMDVAIIGGTGAEGFGLTLRLAKAGHHVTIGSPAAGRAAAKADEAKGIVGRDAEVSGAENPAAAAAAPVVVVTVPFQGAAAIYEAIAASITPETVVCDCTSPLMASVGGRASHALHPWHGSAAEFVRTLLPPGAPLLPGSPPRG